MPQLKSESARAANYRKKLRHDKKDNSLTKEELKHLDQMKRQGRKRIYADEALAKSAREEVLKSQNKDQNVGGDALNLGLDTVSDAAALTRNAIEKRIEKETDRKTQENKTEESKQTQKRHNRETAQKQNPYAEKLNQKPQKAEKPNPSKQRQKKEAADKAREGISSLAEKLHEALANLERVIVENPKVILIALVIGLLIAVIMGCFSSCSIAFSGAEDVMVFTSYTAEDHVIVQVEKDYRKLEKKIQKKIDKIEEDYPDMDEYNYYLDEIGHNPYVLAAILTVVFEDYKRDEVQDYLKELIDKQYDLEIEEVVETRTRTETEYQEIDGELVEVEVEVEYEYHILNVTLTNHTLEEVAQHLGFDEDQMQRFLILCETKGNKEYLFTDMYSLEEPGEEDYGVPAEYLTDEEFARMLHEAEKYLGMEYVWGGSNPDTGFDCSGFVCWVINHCGNGWNYGRTTANGLKARTDRVATSDVRPGDLIFFKGTYDTAGASHVGIVVDPVNKIMIHAGNPIKYSCYDTAYWRSHFYCNGRIK